MAGLENGIADIRVASHAGPESVVKTTVEENIRELFANADQFGHIVGERASVRLVDRVVAVPLPDRHHAAGALECAPVEARYLPRHGRIPPVPRDAHCRSA